MKNKVLIGITILMVVQFLLFACACDSLPREYSFIGMMIPIAWFVVFGLANKDYKLKED